MTTPMIMPRIVSSARFCSLPFTRAENSWNPLERSRLGGSVNFYRRTLAVFGASLSGALFAESRNAQIPNFLVDFANGGFRQFLRRFYLFLKLRQSLQR